MSARTKDAVDRLAERMVAERRRQQQPELEPRGRIRERTRDPDRGR
jgi:hypothetical protein